MSGDRYTTLTAAVTEATPGTITGTAMTYGVDIPRGPGLFERVEAGAFKAQLAAPNRVLVLWGHDWDAPIGRATSLKDADGRLVFEAKVSDNPAIPDAAKTLALLREGIVDEVSVGFEWGTWHEERDADTGALTIVHTKGRLREFSVVPFGALGREATVKSVASAGRLNIEAYRARLAALRS